MEKPLNILVATDYSEAVMNTEHYAIQLAKASGSFLRFLHVFEPPIANQTGSFDANKIDYSPAVYELKKLKEHVSKLIVACGCKSGEINYECLVREGSAGKQIIEEVNETYPDFVIMGTHGASGFREFVLGTHTWQVIKKAGVPVLTLPKEAMFTGMKNIVFATEYREGELPVLNFLTQFAARFKANVNVLHITASIFTKDFENKMTEEFGNELKNRIAYPGVQLYVEHASDIIDGLEKFAKNHKTDLLVMSHARPHFFEKIFTPNSGITKKMSLHTKMPLLVIPDYYNPDFAWFWKLFALDYSMDTDF